MSQAASKDQDVLGSGSELVVTIVIEAVLKFPKALPPRPAAACEIDEDAMETRVQRAKATCQTPAEGLSPSLFASFSPPLQRASNDR